MRAKKEPVSMKPFRAELRAIKASDHRYRSYLKVIATTFMCGILIFGLHYLFLWNAGEVLSFKRVVDRQLKLNAVYGSALNNPSFYGYKLALVNALAPDILILGSSRVMEHRAAPFRGTFANAGGAMTSVDDGIRFLRAVVAKHPPQVLVLGVDFWIFNERAKEIWHPRSPGEGELNAQKLVAPFRWMAQGKLKLGTYLNVLSGRQIKNPETDIPGVGIMALTRSEGFRPDGSYYYRRWYTDDKYQVLPDIRFEGTTHRLVAGSTQFAHGKEVSEERWREFEELLALGKRNGVKFVLYSPPFAQSIYQKLRAMPNDFGFINELDEKLRATGEEYYDFRNPADFGSGDCEFVDGYHGGEVTQYRMLQAILKQNPNSILAPFLKPDVLAEKIDHYAGKALAERLVGPEAGHDAIREADFLKLGCSKAEKK